MRRSFVLTLALLSTTALPVVAQQVPRPLNSPASSTAGDPICAAANNGQQASACPVISLGHGGTAATTTAGARANLGVKNISPADFNAVGDGQYYQDTISFFGATVSDPSAHFSPFDCAPPGTGCLGTRNARIFISNGNLVTNYAGNIVAYHGADQVDVSPTPTASLLTQLEDLQWGTDDCTPLNNTFAAFRTAADYNAPANGASMVFPAGAQNFYTSCSINSTNIGRYNNIKNLVIDGRGSSILAAEVSGVVLDQLGSTGVLLQNILIDAGYYGGNPSVGLYQGRWYYPTNTTNQGAQATNMAVNNVRVDGVFSAAAYINKAAEDSSCINSLFGNNSLASGAHAADYDGINHINIPSAYVTVGIPANTFMSFDDTVETNCTYRNRADATAPLFVSNMRGSRFNGGFVSAQGSNTYEIEVYGGVGAMINNVWDIHMEGNSVLCDFYFNGAGVGGLNLVLTEWEYHTSSSLAQNCIYASNAVQIGSVKFQGYEAHVDSVVNTPQLFDDPTLYSGYGVKESYPTGLTVNLPGIWNGENCNWQFSACKTTGVNRQNLLLNSSLDSWLLGATFAPNTGSVTRGPDGWKLLAAATATNGTRTFSRDTGIVGTQYAMKVQRTPGNTETGQPFIAQQLSTQAMFQAQGKPVFLFCEAQYGADFSPSGLAAFLDTGTGIDEPYNMVAFPTGDAVQTFLPKSTFSGPGTSQHLVFGTVTVPSNATEGAVKIGSGHPAGTAGTNDWFKIGPCSLTISSTEIQYNQPLPQENAQKVKFFYQKSFLAGTVPAQNAGTNTGEFTWAAQAGAVTNQVTVSFDKMGCVPTIQLWNPGAANSQVRNETQGNDLTSSTASNITDHSFRLTATGLSGTAANDNLGVHWTAQCAVP